MVFLYGQGFVFKFLQCNISLFFSFLQAVARLLASIMWHIWLYQYIFRLCLLFIVLILRPSVLSRYYNIREQKVTFPFHICRTHLLPSVLRLLFAVRSGNIWLHALLLGAFVILNEYTQDFWTFLFSIFSSN